MPPEPLADVTPLFRLVSDGPHRWRLSGEIDVAVAAQLAAALTTAVSATVAAADGTGCVIGLHELRFIDLSGTRAIARTATVEGASVDLHGAPPVFRRYWLLGGFTESAPSVRVLT